MSLAVTSLDKPLWPHRTKRDLLLYLLAVSQSILPHLRSRPLTMVRLPSGLGGKKFVQRHWDHKPPEFVRTAEIYTQDRRRAETYLICDNLATLLWLGQNACLELHTWYSRVDAEGYGTNFSESLESVEASALEYPDFMVFDLDPGDTVRATGDKSLTRESFSRLVGVAKALRERLAVAGLNSLIKTSGKSGLHMIVPIERKYPFGWVRTIAEEFARSLVAENPNIVTVETSIAERGERVYIDYGQNARGKSLACVYSPRAVPGATVSFPIEWDRLDAVFPTDFDMSNVPKLLEQQVDKWKGLPSERQALPPIPS